MTDLDAFYAAIRAWIDLHFDHNITLYSREAQPGTPRSVRLSWANTKGNTMYNDRNLIIVEETGVERIMVFNPDEQDNKLAKAAIKIARRCARHV